MLNKAPRFFLAIFFLSAAPALLGCSRQEEGERCAPTNGDSDCEEDLVCTELRDGESTIYRCCPEAGESSTDERCELQAVVGDGDALGEGGAGGMSSPDDEPAGLGSNCVYQKDCVAPLVCLPGGTCNYECMDDRDCDDDETCSVDQSCVAR